MRPLEGVKIVDFTQALAGPYCTMILADLGADVVKVEPIGRGDDTRHWGSPTFDDVGYYYYAINRNKRSLAMDLKNDASRPIVKKLIRSSDVVVQNWRPGVAERLGLDYRTIQSYAPDVIFTSLTGFGVDAGAKAGYDTIIQGVSGLMSLTGSADGTPMKAGFGVADIVSGMFSAIATLGGLLGRENNGSGVSVDVAMQDSAVALLAYQATRYFATGAAPGREGNDHNSIAPYSTFEAADGYVNICAGNERHWQAFCEVLDLGELLVDPRFADSYSRVAFKSELYDIIRPRIREDKVIDLLDTFSRVGIAAGPVRTLDEVFSDEILLTRGMKQDYETRDGTISAPGVPWHYNGGTVGFRTPPCALGWHTQVVLRELGFDDAQIRELTQAGVVGVAVVDKQ